MAALAVGGHVLGTIAGIASARTQGVAAQFEGQVAAANARNEAEAYKFNAKVAEQEAKNALDVARAEASDFGRVGSAALASRRAATAASGVVSTSGSPLMVDTAIDTEILFGQARIKNQGEIIATRKRNEARLLRMHAKQAKQNARFAMQGARLGQSAAKIGMYSAVASGAVGIGNTIMTASSSGYK